MFAMILFCLADKISVAWIEDSRLKYAAADSLNHEKGVPRQLLANKRALEGTWPSTVRLAAASQHDSLVFMLAFFSGD
jgi:hypothetical protein